ILVLTGELGGAAAGLFLLENPGEAASLDDGLRAALIGRQREPRPRLDAGRALAAAGATAMIDLSDGLAGDAAQLAAPSVAGRRIDAGALPIAAGVAEVAAEAGRDALEMAASGGEDYELLAALPPDRVEEALAAVAAADGAAPTPIGELVAGNGVEIRLLPDGPKVRPAGFDHLA